MRRLAIIGLGLALAASAVRAQEAAPPTNVPVEPLPPSSPAPSLDAPEVPAPLPPPPTLDLTPSAERVTPPGLEDPANAAAPPDATSDAALSADLAALGLDLNDNGVDLGFHFSGFADFTSVFPIKPRGAPAVTVPNYQTFYVGNVNLYLSKNLSESFRMMGEVRFTYLPNGGLIPAPGALNYTSTAITDYADNDRVTKWGSIILQRMYLEWTLNPLILVRAGQFLTPYGIWNVDHGSPAYIPITRPYAVNSNYFPQSQVGLEILGRWNVSNSSTIGYHLTVSNGGGTFSDIRDFDKNKALGARLYWEHQAAGFFRLGFSGYYGEETDAVPNASFSTTDIMVGQTTSNQFYELNLGADITYKYHGFIFQAEGVTQQKKYTDAGRLSHGEFFSTESTAFSANFLAWAAYGLVAYTLPWYAITPYVLVQHSREELVGNVPDYILDAIIWEGGFTIHPIDAVTFKVEYNRTDFHNGGVILKYPINLVQLQAAWAF